MIFQKTAQAMTVGFSLLAAMPAAAEANKSILVLDASGSMWGQIDGEAKITIARRVIGDLLDTFPEDQALGLSAYGHNRKGDCGDIEQLVAPSLDSGPAIRAAVEAINPKGKTPLAAAVIDAAQSLRSEEEPATIILISDGIETCGLDPCAIGAELEKSGVDFTTHVIGFDVGLSEDRDQLACLAGSTGGEFLAAADAAELSQALEIVADTLPVREPEPVVVAEPEVIVIPNSLTISDTAASKDRANPADLDIMEIVSGRVGENVSHFWNVTLEPGTYHIVVDVERADDDYSFNQLKVNFTGADGRPGFRGISASDYYTRQRFMRTVEITSRFDLIIDLGEASDTLDYDLAIVPTDKDVPVPYLIGAANISELAIGQKAVANIEGTSQDAGEVFYEVTLGAKDYEFIAEMTDVRGESGFFSAEAVILGQYGEKLRSTKRLCHLQGYEQTLSCATRTSLADERRFVIRLNGVTISNDDGTFLTGFTINERD